ncbi:MAG: hypothetical protein IJD26_09335 [Lachnospiraceae bacterium]|nr:hypothetical protein [Lachnospiraceae bacterium]
MKNEKSKSTLALMEQAVMILVFAVAATLCVQAFVRADAYSKELERRDRAVNLCQTVAETVKAKKGDLKATAAQSEATVSGGMMFLYYNKEWEPVTEQDAVYVLCLEETGRNGYVTAAQVRVTMKKSGEEVFALPVRWQEVDYE